MKKKNCFKFLKKKKMIYNLKKKKKKKKSCAKYNDGKERGRALEKRKKPRLKKFYD